MSQFANVDGERFRIDERVQFDGRRSLDFTWLNGPAGGTYGFTVGWAENAPLSSAPLLDLEVMASDFVRAFFSDDGIGTSDFPEFVAARRAGL